MFIHGNINMKNIIVKARYLSSKPWKSVNNSGEMR